MHRRLVRRAGLSLAAAAGFFLFILELRVEVEDPLLDSSFFGLDSETWGPDESLTSSSGADWERRAMDLSPLPRDNLEQPEVSVRPWYMAGGQLRPQHCVLDSGTGECNVTIWPEDRQGDRLRDQLMYLPPTGFVADRQEDADTPLKKILFWNGASSWLVRPGRGVFLKEQCPVSSCVIATNRREGPTADLVVFKDHFTMPGMERSAEQLWMIFMLESPLHTQNFKHADVFNWTATYRADSTVVAPYERWQYYNDNVRAREQEVNYAASKTKKVAWFVSNCGARNQRLEYARNLSNFINVDIFGTCGDKRCPRSSKDCLGMLDTDYKFYLAFENSNCVDYITEKFFVNGLKHNVLPIVMGARKEDYERSSPNNSFIHVDDFRGPAELAEYLHKLDKDDVLYNSYFRWKGTGEMINTKFFCRLCALLHDPKERIEDSRSYKDINSWWRGEGTCIKGSWKKFQAALSRKKTKVSKN